MILWILMMAPSASDNAVENQAKALEIFREVQLCYEQSVQLNLKSEQSGSEKYYWCQPVKMGNLS